MSVPKKRQAKGRTRRRRAHHGVTTPPYKLCADGSVVPRHHACPEDLEKNK